MGKYISLTTHTAPESAIGEYVHGNKLGGVLSQDALPGTQTAKTQNQITKDTQGVDTVDTQATGFKNACN